MEDMDIDQVVEIPDTPDRITAQNNNGRKITGKQIGVSIPVHSSNSAIVDGERLNWPRNRDGLGTESGNHRKPDLLSRNDIIRVDEESCNNSNEIFPVESSFASRNGPLIRKMAIERNFTRETKHPLGAQRKDKGKDLFAKFPCKSSSCQGYDVLDLNEHNASWRMIDMSPISASNDIQNGERRKGQIATDGGSSFHAAPYRPKTCNDDRKGKEKVDVDGCKGAASAANHGRGINFSGSSQGKTEKQISASHHFVTPPRVSGQKRLVRNGCISPHNIAARAKKETESPLISKDVEVTHGSNMDFNGQCPIDISEIVAEENNCGRLKGKGIATYPCKMKEHDASIARWPSRVLAIHNEKPNRTSDIRRHAYRCFQGRNGWRNTHSHSKKIGPSSDANGHVSVPHDDFSCIVNQQHGNNLSGYVNIESWDSPENLSSTQTTSSILSDLEQQHQSHNSLNIKNRQKQVGMTSQNDGERSLAVSDDSDVLFLGSSGESSHSNLFRLQSHQNQGIMDSAFEVEEFSDEIRCNMHEDIGNIASDNSEAKARQLEADEIFARKLQEQFYHEVPPYESCEIDENIAWALQQEESGIPDVSYQNQRVSFSRSSTSQLHRQPQLRSFQNQSYRRGRIRTRTPSSRTTRLRNRILDGSPTALPRERNFQFPPNMDLDMRLDVLEALEAAFDDANDWRITSRQFNQDFNNVDYELFLALDENNYQHTGASANQINNLPQSIVQSENIEEACAICLETPTIGETIRHLPCLHKFHKDCIDAWLGRKTSCPVCKSSIT